MTRFSLTGWRRDVVWLLLFTCIYVWGAGTDYPAH